MPHLDIYFLGKCAVKGLHHHTIITATVMSVCLCKYLHNLLQANISDSVYKIYIQFLNFNLCYYFMLLLENLLPFWEAGRNRKHSKGIAPLINFLICLLS